MARTLNTEQYNRLKVSTRMLMRNMGGVESASNFTRVQHAQLGAYQNINKPEHFAPIDVIADLEHEIGDPVVSKALCAMAGGYFMPATFYGDQPVFATHLAEIGKEVSEVMQAAGTALTDGTISKGEAQDLISEIDDAINALASARSYLDAGSEGE